MNKTIIKRGFFALVAILAVAVTFVPGPNTVNAAAATRGSGTISAGGNHSMAIDTNGTLWAWGSNEFGQLGDGTTVSRPNPIRIMDSVTAVATGAEHTAAIMSDGSLWTWGSNSRGQLGDGAFSAGYHPIWIMDSVIAVAAGSFHTVAITSDGTLWAWGANGRGQLGDGTTTDRHSPVRIMGSVSSVAAGMAHTAAISSDGTLLAWGWNDFGQLGNGTTAERHTPNIILSDVIAVSAGSAHTAAITSNGQLWAWGLNSRGQLGDGTTTDHHYPAWIMDSAVYVSTGSYYTSAITTGGNLWTWGANLAGQLGFGDSVERHSPGLVMSDVVAVSAGDSRTLAITTDGNLWAWGANTYGQLVWIMDNIKLPGSNVPHFAHVEDAPASPAAAAGLTAEPIVSEPEQENGWWQNIRYYIDPFIDPFLEIAKEYLLTAQEFFFSLPLIARILPYILLATASAAVLAGYGISIYKNRKNWLAHPKYKLKYSYFTRSGNHQRAVSLRHARYANRDHRWWLYCFAGLAHKLGNFSNKSQMLMFVMSIAYLPLAFLGIIEMIFRVIIGFFWFLSASLVLRLFFILTRLLSSLIRPFATMIDGVLRKRQYCPHCYDDFRLPEIFCPNCNAVHTQLVPTDCGILFARCQCEKPFLPVAAFTGRSRLEASCPSCKGGLAAANAVQFSVQLIGASKPVKETFLANFTQRYLGAANQRKNLDIYERPMDGNETWTYNFLHKYGKGAPKDNLVFYDISGEVVAEGAYPKSPKNFGFCDGIILFIEPEDDNDIDTVISQFADQFKGIRGLTAKKLDSLPVAVMITGAQGNSEACRSYLKNSGLGNTLNNIEANFSNVRFFPHVPDGVVAPVCWIAKEERANIANLLEIAMIKSGVIR